MQDLAGDPATTKSGEYDDTVVFGDAASKRAGRALAADVLARLKKETRGTKHVFPFSIGLVEQTFSEAVKSCGLVALRCTPHCCRHGGPSADYATRHRTLSEIRRRGRWKSELSLRRYEKSGRLAKQVSKLSADQIRKAKLVAAQLHSLLE